MSPAPDEYGQPQHRDQDRATGAKDHDYAVDGVGEVVRSLDQGGFEPVGCRKYVRQPHVRDTTNNRPTEGPTVQHGAGGNFGYGRTVTRRELLAFMRTHTLAVEASVSTPATPQAAVVGIAVTDDFEIVFDTVVATRKVPNLRRNPRIAFVIGGLTAGDERSVQYEGIADEPQGAELLRLKELYFSQLLDGPERQRWPGIVYVRVRPTWIRYSDFNQDPPEVAEFSFDPSGMN